MWQVLVIWLFSTKLFLQLAITSLNWTLQLNHKHVELATLITYLCSFAKCHLIRMIYASAIYHIIKMVTSGAARLVGQVGQWAMAHLKGLGPHMNTLCGLFWFLPYLPFQEPKLPYHLCKRFLEGESLELFLVQDGLEEAQWADVSPLLKDFRFLPYLPYQVPKLPYHLCKMRFRK